MDYKALMEEARRRKIPYAYRAGSKTKYVSKEELEKRLGIAPNAPGPIASIPANEPIDKPKTATPTEEKGMGILEIAISELLDKNISKFDNRIAKIEQCISAGGYSGMEIKSPLGTVKIDGLTHTQFAHVLRLASQRCNILLVGPSGTGKTHLAAQVAKALNLPFAFISVSAGMSESMLEGHLLPIGDGGRFEYVPSAFVTMYENGGVFLLDEFDSADANLMTLINSALANGHMAVGKRLQDKIIKRHADFICIAAANTYGHGATRVYAGRQQLDAATLDRFRAGIVFIDYDKRIEKALCDADLLDWGHETRRKIMAHGLRRIMSTRFLKDYSALIKAYPAEYNVETAKATYFSDWSDDEKGKVA